MNFQPFAQPLNCLARAAGLSGIGVLSLISVGNGQTNGERIAAEVTNNRVQTSSLAPNVDDEISTLIRQLNHPTFAIRESATRRLLDLGEASLQGLRKAEQDGSPEVRERASRIAAEVQRLVFEKRAKGFLISTNPSEDFGLPGWAPFSAQVGSTRSSKLLFLEMVRRQKDLALAIDSASKAAGTPDEQATADRMNSAAAEISQQFTTNMNYGVSYPEVGDVVALLVASSLLKGQAPIEVNRTIVLAIYRTEVGDYFNKAGYGRCMRTLAGKWIPKTQEVLAADVLSLAMQKEIPEGVVVARRHLGKQSDTDIRQFAFQCLSRFGDSTDLEIVGRHLKDDTIVHQFEESISILNDDIDEENSAPPLGNQGPKVTPARTLTVRIGDIALATCMTIAKEDPTAVFPRFRSSPMIGFYVNSVACSSDDQALRTAAIENWLKRYGERPLDSN